MNKRNARRYEPIGNRRNAGIFEPVSQMDIIKEKIKKSLLIKIAIGFILLGLLILFIIWLVSSDSTDAIPENINSCETKYGKLNGDKWTFTLWVKANRDMDIGENKTIVDLCGGYPKVKYGNCINFAMELKKAGCDTCSNEICLNSSGGVIDSNCSYYNKVEKDTWYFIAWSQNGGERRIQYSNPNVPYLDGIAYQCNAFLDKKNEYFTLNNHNGIFEFRDVKIHKKGLSYDEIYDIYINQQ